MFSRLLVPLDGSPLAEAALPAARCLVERLDAEVTVLHMLERRAPTAVHGQPHLTTGEEAQEYLAKLAERTFSGRPVARHVHTPHVADVARSIVAHAEEMQIDLIILCAHGAGGVRHGLFGTVAQRVISLGTTPVLLVPVPQKDAVPPPPFSCQRLLVPLDGNADHEQGLDAIGKLGGGHGDHALLVMVIPLWRDLKQSNLVTSRTLPGTTAELLRASWGPSHAYLDEKVKTIETAGYDVTSRLVRGDPVSAISSAAREFNADLIVLATHGTTHLDAFWSESLTPQLMRRSRLPILLVPVRGEISIH